MILCSWDNRMGLNIEYEFPEGTSQIITKDDLLSIFISSALSSDPGVFIYNIKNRELVFYYTGKPKDEKGDQFLITIILSQNDQSEIFANYLSIIGELIINEISKEDFKDFFIDCYEVASKAKISETQKLAFFLKNEITKTILEILKEGPITTRDLLKYLKHQLKKDIENVERFTKPLINSNIIIEKEIVEGVRKVKYLLLIRDIGIMRAPPLKALKKTSPNIREFLFKKILEFFKNYEPTDSDNQLLLNLISNPGIYEIMHILHNEPIKPEEIYSKLGFKMHNAFYNIKKLTDANIVKSFKDNNDQIWLCLLSDIYVSTLFPDYMIDVIHNNWELGLINDELSLFYLDLLKKEAFKELK